MAGTIACIHCGTENQLPPPQDFDNLITMRCRHCDGITPTGRETTVRRVFEVNSTISKTPPVASARGIALSTTIWARAKKNQVGLDISKTQAAVKEHLGAIGNEAPEIVATFITAGRSHQGFTESGTQAAAVVVIDNKASNPRYSIFVVFRGSASELTAKEDDSVVVDWRANLDNRMTSLGYGGDALRVHRGFKDILSSYRDEVLRNLRKAMRIFTNNHVVVTGHSQGGGHAILFTHWLYHTTDIKAACIPFSAPRVGNFPFAWDFTRRISHRSMFYPFDGVYNGAYLVYKGRDPVVNQVKHSTTWGNKPGTMEEAADGGMIKGGLMAIWHEHFNPVMQDPYFHPKTLVRLPSWQMISIYDHSPYGIRKQFLKRLN